MSSGNSQVAVEKLRTTVPTDRYGISTGVEGLQNPSAGRVGALQSPIQRPGIAEPRITNNSDEAPIHPVETLVHALRWFGLAVSVLVVTVRSDDFRIAALAALVVIGSYTCFRTIFPLAIPPSRKGLRRVASFTDLALHLGAVIISGLWGSALIYPLAISVVVFHLMFGRLLGAIATILTAGTLTFMTVAGSDNIAEGSVEGAVTLTIGAVLGGFVHQATISNLSDDSADDQTFAKLTVTNRLLNDLHQVTESLPNPFDHRKVLQSSISELRTLVSFDSAAIFMYNPLGNQWLVAHQEGMPVDSCIYGGNLPPLALLAAREKRAVRTSNDRVHSKRFFTNSDSAIFTPLVVDNQLLGLLAIESRDRDAFNLTNLKLLESHTNVLALTIDNARRIDLIRQKGADEERSRIARAIHDDTGQSLAYLGFELDRIIRNNSDGEPVGDELERLRSDIKIAIGEVRETLYDLRTDVGEQKDLIETIEEFTSRIANRTGLVVGFTHNADGRLPIPQEREIWKIAQEALINAERHADASRVDIFWTCNDAVASLEIVDDGRGLPSDSSGQFDSYGILGMRERATRIGALLAFISQPNQGTRVRCILNRN